MSWEDEYLAKRDEEDEIIHGHIENLEREIAARKTQLDVKTSKAKLWRILFILIAIALVTLALFPYR